jgi:uncharacterized delta-60 repeat protein
MGARPKNLLAASATALALGLCLCAPALGIDQTDRTFGTDGVAEIPLPPEAHAHEGLPAILDLAGDPGGKMVAAIGGGFFSSRYFGAASFTPDGTLDDSFGSEGFTEQVEIHREEMLVRSQAQAVAAQSDGKIILVGYQLDDVHGTAPVLARYLPDGSLDQSFGDDGLVTPKPASEGTDGAHPVEGGGILHDVAIQTNGRIVAVGAQNEFHGAPPADMVIAYKPNGRLDRSFGHHGRVLFPVVHRGFESTALHSVKILADGKILLAGYRLGHLFLARLTKTGALDDRFGGGDGKVSLKVNHTRSGETNCCQDDAALAVQSDGRILVASESLGLTYEGLALVRFKANGALDRSFGRGGFLAQRIAQRVGIPSDVAVQGNGRILVVGQGQEKLNIFLSALRLLPSGKVDRKFGQNGIAKLDRGGQAAAFAALTQRNGRVVAGGAFEIGSPENRITKLLMTRYSAR